MWLKIGIADPESMRRSSHFFVESDCGGEVRERSEYPAEVIQQHTCSTVWKLDVDELRGGLELSIRCCMVLTTNP